MLSIINSTSLIGIDGYLVEVQVDTGDNLEWWEIVGMPDTSIKEAKERVRTAIRNCGYSLEGVKILINLAPAEIKKEGSGFDLAMAIGVLASVEYVQNRELSNYAFLGELSLDGKVNPILGILPMCIELKRLGIKKVVLPKECALEASIVQGVEVYGVSSLNEAVDFLNGDIVVKRTETDIAKVINNQRDDSINFDEVKGQENVKRGLEIAAAGRS